MNSQEKENKSLKRTLHVLISKAERNQEILQTFQDIELSLLSCHRLTDLIDMLLINLKEYFLLDSISLVLFDPEHTARDLIEDYQSPGPNQLLQFLDSYPLLTEIHPNLNQPLLISPDKRIKDFSFPNTPHIASCALLPLVRQNVIIGSLHLGSRDLERYGKNVATDYISHMASIISVCIENCISQETLRRLSIIDMLTKVNNRRSFDQELLKELARASRNQYPLSCLFIDLDHFKHINDAHGHQTGDRVLRDAAQAIKKQLRKTDIIARYGGEEFVVLLPSCDYQRAFQAAESTRESIRSLRFISDENLPFQVTLSIGVSTCEPESFVESDLLSYAHQLVACADAGVYQAKESGRDRVVYAPMTYVKTSQAAKMDADLLTTFGSEG